MLFVVCLGAMLSAGCREQKKLLDEARQAQAASKLDEALTTLEIVKSRFPDSPEAREARVLATEWLIQAADKAPGPQDRKLRLDQALAWTPDSGAAQARLCLVRLELSDFEAARTCLSADLRDKKAVPEELVSRAKEALARHDSELSAGERKRLLGSKSPSQWQELVKRYPGSEEARQAERKLKSHGSLCVELERFTKPMRAEIDRQLVLATNAATPPPDPDARLRRYDDMRRDTLDFAHDMSDLKASIEAHDARPDEQALKKELVSLAQALGDSAATLADDLERHPLENLDTYAASAQAAVARWTAALKKLGVRVEKELAQASEACEK
jgi:hypothetical protein